MVHTRRMGLHAEYAAKIRKLAASDALSDQEFLGRVLVSASLWRSKLWANTLARQDTKIRSGPFEGMDYVVNVTEGALLPRLLGVYERELHADLARFAAEGVTTVIDIGCAEGYYAVGLARLMPQARVHAFDIDEVAQRRCRILAEANGVGDRVEVGGEFSGADFERFRDSGALVICDAEGFEDELLRPDLHPALEGLNLIVETHPGEKPGVTDRLIERFAPTHDIRRINPRVMDAPLPASTTKNSHLDMMIACWEWRALPTPWLVMRPKAAIG